MTAPWSRRSVRRPASPRPPGRSFPRRRLRPLLPNDGASPGRRGRRRRRHRPGLGGIGGFDAVEPLRPWLLGIAANRCRTSLGRGRGDHRSPSPPRKRLTTGPGLTDPDDLAGELERALTASGPNIAWSSPCSTSKVCRTKRSPRRSAGRSGPSRPGSIAPAPSWPTTFPAGASAVESGEVAMELGREFSRKLSRAGNNLGSLIAIMSGRALNNTGCSIPRPLAGGGLTPRLDLRGVPGPLVGIPGASPGDRRLAFAPRLLRARSIERLHGF